MDGEEGGLGFFGAGIVIMPLYESHVSFLGELRSAWEILVCDVKRSSTRRAGFFCTCSFFKSQFQTVIERILEASPEKQPEHFVI